eukprot:CAMPEP_0198351900 /NCGR_PEP_ID=MMETSP1450-20131203/104740_1 /TAXON_ID=753684 ORGANISM="Madagascaria erythrocladiodes, Strain CCMP3234" /NCGR_SAMPLE_ID=MMETSP1450 /ASSEMBLY_ACC=CAM_ASM_001115 /LENGTH=62 /DNA_ID=CAMNT_0044057875 /DNA_START=18 /DNA_END=203 /DNA_ORIENTATION=+
MSYSRVLARLRDRHEKCEGSQCQSDSSVGPDEIAKAIDVLSKLASIDSSTLDQLESTERALS